ncbi:MAG: hypothetical protein DCF15_18445, partial [Phormidesmis priestleyi]
MGANNEHRADVRLDSGLVLELQHSSISAETIAEREQFYGFMVWLFDAQGFKKNLEIRTGYSAYTTLAEDSPLAGIDDLANSIESKIQTAQTRLIEFSAAYERVKRRLQGLCVSLLEKSYYRQDSSYSIIEAFGSGREGLVALTEAANKHRQLIKKVLVNLPSGDRKKPPYFSLEPWHVFDYLISGELYDIRRIQKFQRRWKQRVWPRASREQEFIVGTIARFIWCNITASASCYTHEPNKVLPVGWERSVRKDCWQDEAIAPMIADSAMERG